MEFDQCEFSIEIFRQGRAIFNPIAAIHIDHIAQVPDFRTMNVPANDACHAILPRILDHGVLVVSHVFYGGLCLQFDKGSE